MEILLLLLIAIPFVVPAAAICAGAGLVVALLIYLRVIRRRWQAMVAVPVIGVLLPLWWIWSRQVSMEECFALHGQGELSCGGELGGLFMDLGRIVIVLMVLGLGPFVGSRVYRRVRPHSIGEAHE